MTSTADAHAQEAFLRSFHAERPAVTSETFGEGTSGDGRSSYRIVADLAAGARRVVELGCGDGLLLELLARTRDAADLAGVDLSPEALALARRRPALAGAALLEGRTQRLPFEDGSFDACVSHMALTLMADVEQVAAEAARVLVPGGLLVCALGGGAAGGEAYELFASLLRRASADLPGERRVPRLGDARTRTAEGMAEILGPAGFDRLTWSTARIDFGGPVERVWESMAGVYNMGPLPATAVDGLRQAFLAGAAELAPPGGTVPCAMTMKFATARLRG